ncbi:hypothetical protein [uncultured Duncaniella sp.]|uniref:hypothetical protein n=1 Tax=uncultured Duncaniella sp. TaxID=2768039 RepID=UPI0025B6C56C|nr:hypothetical protein [uncultured Duncaniella sp.]
MLESLTWAIISIGTRSLQTMRSSGKIGYSIVDGKVFYPVKEIDRVLTKSYKYVLLKN